MRMRNDTFQISLLLSVIYLSNTQGICYQICNNVTEYCDEVLGVCQNCRLLCWAVGRSYTPEALRIKSSCQSHCPVFYNSTVIQRFEPFTTSQPKANKTIHQTNVETVDKKTLHTYWLTTLASLIFIISLFAVWKKTRGFQILSRLMTKMRNGPQVAQEEGGQNISKLVLNDRVFDHQILSIQAPEPDASQCEDITTLKMPVETLLHRNNHGPSSSLMEIDENTEDHSANINQLSYISDTFMQIDENNYDEQCTLSYDSSISPEEKLKSIKVKIDRHKSCGYIIETMVEDSKLKVIIDGGTVLKCDSFLKDSFPNDYENDLFEIKEMPWKLCGKDDPVLYIRVMSQDYTKKLKLECKFKSNISPGSCIFLAPTENRNNISLDGSIKSKEDIPENLAPGNIFFGTIGAFFKDEKLNIYALTSHHAIFEYAIGFATDYIQSNSTKGACYLKPENIKTAMSERQSESNNDRGPNLVIIGNKKSGLRSEDHTYIVKPSQETSKKTPSGKKEKYTLFDIALVELTNEENLFSKEYFQPLGWEDGKNGNDIELHFADNEDYKIGVEVQKIGAKTGLTRGKIYECENQCKKDSVFQSEGSFLVEGIDEPFSENGDSGSLVTTLNYGKRKVLGIEYGCHDRKRTVCLDFRRNFTALNNKMAEYGRNITFLQQKDLKELRIKHRPKRETSASSSQADSLFGEEETRETSESSSRTDSRDSGFSSSTSLKIVPSPSSLFSTPRDGTS